ncbi:MAG: helix-turn-helix domain-containing protein [Solirubrobacteraceae bacterium]
MPTFIPEDERGVHRAAASSDQKQFRLYSAASIGPAIRAYRKDAGLTQQQLADMAGLHRSYISELEHGKETEQLRRVLRLLKLLGVRATLQKVDW